MSDQAQGLRALADQTRRDQTGISPCPERSAGIAASALPSLSGNIAPPDAGSSSSQATSSMALVDGRLHAATRPAPAPRARVIAVTSGKGGVGKTNFTSNLSLVMAGSGQRVIAVDADLGLANLHVVLGVTPRYHLEHVLHGERTLRETLHQAPCGLQIIAGGSGITELANLDEQRRDAFIASLSELDTLADVILLDTGAGLSRNVLAFLCAVDEIIVVTTPEPTAITDAYATIKVVTHENPTARLMLVVNMAQSEAEAEAVASRLVRIASQFLGIQVEFLGHIPYDPVVGRAVRKQQPFALNQPDSAASRGIIRIALQLGYRPRNAVPPGGIRGFLTRMQRFFAA
ncbi:MAG: MinD/ParA family protein [Chloroherpetonaceae bacterium]|nr:MinD/ParA family protein [Chthonomonadaceae bacterium]MDW8206586.1 MinD/ParA family protein [Chloroherpetonaceae bacterium]